MNPTNPLDEALASQISPLCYDVFALQDHTDLDLDALYITKRFSKKVLDRALESHTSLSYDDVLIRPGHADFNLGEVDLTTRFSKKVSLKIPIVSAAMDTVTEYQMAIAIAIEGGLGIIHRNMTPEKQAHQVRKVKRHLNGLIDNPEWVDGEETLNEIRVRFANKYGGLRYHSFPILNDESRLIGILGEKSFRYGDQNKTAQQAALEQMETGNRGEGVQETTIREAYKIMNEKRIGSLPLTDKEGKLNGMYVFSDVERIITGAGTYNTDDKEQLIVGAAIGVHEDAERRLEQLVEANVDVVVIDSSHGDSENVIETLKKIKSQSKYNHIDVVVGNVSVGESVERLVDAGADGIKVGQGPGSICTTRVVAGAGRGQMIAIYDCARKARGYGIPLCADGGIVYSGDITKAIAGGADSVMLGGLLAGVEESPGETILLNGRQWKTYRGMGSLGAMQQHESSRQRYGINSPLKLVPEGVEGLEPYKGKLAEVIFQHTGGLRAGMGYAGARTIKDLKEGGDFDRLTTSSLRESHPHDLIITKEAPNYRSKNNPE